MAITKEPSVTMFMEKPIKLIKIKVANREIGMEAPTIKLAFQSPKNITNTSMVSAIPSSKVSNTLIKESTMESLAL